MVCGSRSRNSASMLSPPWPSFMDSRPAYKRRCGSSSPKAALLSDCMRVVTRDARIATPLLFHSTPDWERRNSRQAAEFRLREPLLARSRCAISTRRPAGCMHAREARRGEPRREPVGWPPKNPAAPLPPALVRGAVRRGIGMPATSAG